MAIAKHIHNPPPRRGIAYAVASAIAFGLSTPFARLELAAIHPALLAADLYLGAGLALGIVAGFTRTRVRFPRSDIPWLALAALFGGVIGPLLLLFGLRTTAASTASLLLTLEGAFTALLAWRFFNESIDRRLASGIALLVAGSILLVPGPTTGATRSWWGPALIVLACVSWGIDNNVTRKISASDVRITVMVKGFTAGMCNLAIAWIVGARWPGVTHTVRALGLGAVSYGASLALFVLALRDLGSARTSSWFSLAPFAGVAASLLVLGERPGPFAWMAAALMAGGLYLHASERHHHEHTHEPTEHEHPHSHDEHHRHAHDPGATEADRHTHPHRHDRLRHVHPHFPDIHHRHEH